VSLQINLLGRYSFTLPEPVARRALRPPRNAEEAMGFTSRCRRLVSDQWPISLRQH